MIIYYTDRYSGKRGDSHKLLEKAIAAYMSMCGSEGSVCRGIDDEICDEPDNEGLCAAAELVSRMKKGEQGKPYIEGFDCFSISHTENIWAVLFADAECGLDIQMGRSCNMKAIAQRAYAPADAEKVISLLESEACETDDSGSADRSPAYNEFFRIWTRREALAKCMGGSAFDSSLPSVDGNRVIMDGAVCTIFDTGLPGMPEVYAAAAFRGQGGTFFEKATFLGNKINICSVLL